MESRKMSLTVKIYKHGKLNHFKKCRKEIGGYSEKTMKFILEVERLLIL